MSLFKFVPISPMLEILKTYMGSTIKLFTIPSFNALNSLSYRKSISIKILKELYQKVKKNSFIYLLLLIQVYAGWDNRLFFAYI